MICLVMYFSAAPKETAHDDHLEACLWAWRFQESCGYKYPYVSIHYLCYRTEPRALPSRVLPLTQAYLRHRPGNPSPKATFLGSHSATMTFTRRTSDASSTADIHGSTESAQEEILVFFHHRKRLELVPVLLKFRKLTTTWV